MIAEILKPNRFLQDEFPGMICSYKVDCRKEPPEGARLICYHGNPRPKQTNWAAGNADHFMRLHGVSPPPARALTVENQLNGNHSNTRR
jgi:hypothetical protein